MASTDDPIVISGEITRADFDAAFKWNAAALCRRGRSLIESLLVIAAAIVLIVFAVPFAIIATVGEHAATPAMTAALFGYLVGIAFVGIQNRGMMGRVRRLRVSGLGPCTFRFGPKGLDVELSSGASSHTPWTAVKRFEMTPRHLAFWHDSAFAQFVPRVIFGGSGKEADLLSVGARWAPHLALPNAGANKSV